MSIGTNLNNNNLNMVIDTVSIAAAGTTSNAIDLQGRALVNISTPSAISGAAFTFQSSYDGVAYQQYVSQGGGAVTVTCAAAKNVSVDPILLSGVRYVKLVRDNAQAAKKLIKIISRNVD